VKFWFPISLRFNPLKR